MQKVGDITSTATPEGEFTDGNVAGGVNPTLLMALWFNTIQRELCNVVTESGGTLDPNDFTQIVKAIKKISGDELDGKGFLAASNNLSDLDSAPESRKNLGLKSAATCDTGTNVGNVLVVGAGGLLAGTYVSDAADKTSIGGRAATGCQFMRAHQSPDAPDQTSYWQIITLTEVVSPTSAVDVLAISGNNVLFGHGTGAGITSWRHVAMLEGANFTGDISAPNMRGVTLVTVGDGSGGLAKGDFDGAGFNGNNLNIKSWNGIGFQNSEDLAIRAYISTRLGVIAAAENLQAGSAILNKNGDVYGDIWNTGSGPGWLSAFVSTKPGRQYITQVGVYNNDKTKPFMLHDDNSGIFLATLGMLPTAGLGANGWHKDNATGVITQWGSGGYSSGRRINFPVTFPTYCAAVVGNDTGNGTLAISTTLQDVGGFTVRGSQSTFGLSWIAKGY